MAAVACTTDDDVLVFAAIEEDVDDDVDGCRLLCDKVSVVAAIRCPHRS